MQTAAREPSISAAAGSQDHCSWISAGVLSPATLHLRISWSDPTLPFVDLSLWLLGHPCPCLWLSVVLICSSRLSDLELAAADKRIFLSQSWPGTPYSHKSRYADSTAGTKTTCSCSTSGGNNTRQHAQRAALGAARYLLHHKCATAACHDAVYAPHFLREFTCLSMTENRCLMCSAAAGLRGCNNMRRTALAHELVYCCGFLLTAAAVMYLGLWLGEFDSSLLEEWTCPARSESRCLA